MGQSFHRVEALDDVVAEVSRRASSTDVFVGVLPRWRRGGGRRDMVDRASVLWVDCDTPDAAAALEVFRPAASMVVASGGAGHRHAYWLLAESVAIDAIERANRRLACALNADRGAASRRGSSGPREACGTRRRRARRCGCCALTTLAGMGSAKLSRRCPTRQPSPARGSQRGRRGAIGAIRCSRSRQPSMSSG